MFGQYAVGGVVRDVRTSQPLAYATVAAENTALGTVTQLDGTFRLDGLTGDTTVLVVDFLGYTRARSVVVWSGRQTVFQTIELEPAGIQLSEVTVEGVAEGQIAAMVQMRQAENIKHVVTAAQILTFPDMNAAEVMQRIPGVTLQRDQGEGRFVQLRGTPPALTNFNINGEQIPSPEGSYRFVGMDIIPADQIEAVEVTKVLTPDMDADGIGGSVNIETKAARDGAPQFRLTAAGGYNKLRQRPNYSLQLAYGHRYRQLGFQLNASLFENQMGADNLEFSFVKGPFFNSNSQNSGTDNYQVHYREAQFRHYDIRRTRISLSPTLDYSLDKRHRWFLKGMYNHFADREIRRRLIYELEDPLNANYFLYGGISHDVRERTKQQYLGTLSFGGRHEWPFLQLDYQLLAAVAAESEPDRLEARFDSPGQAVIIDFDTEDPDFPVPHFPDQASAALATAYDRFELDEMRLQQHRSHEFLLTPRINLTLPVRLRSGNGFIRFGAKLRSRQKERDVRAQQFGAYRETSILYPGTGDPLNLISASDGFSENNLLNRGFRMSHMPSAPVLRDFHAFFPQFFIIDRNETRKQSYNQDYRYRENIFAAYAMFRFDRKDWMLLGGLRFENTTVLQNQGFGVLLDGNKFIGIDTLDNRRTIDLLLPQLQFKYRLSPSVNLRAAITKTYSRPNYDEVIPSREEDRQEVRVGNPGLAFPTARNFDLMLERYHRKSIFSAGFFYKYIEDFVFTFQRFGREGAPGSGNYPVFEFTKPLNGRNARVMGLESQAQFKLDGLDFFLRHVGLYFNYTFTRSEARIPRRTSANYASAVILNPLADDLSAFFATEGEETIPLPGQARHTLNIGVFYDNNRFFARLLANFQDDFLVELGPDPDLDEYYGKALRFDLTMNYRISDEVQLFADGVNLANTPLRYYLGSPDVVQQQEFYSWWARIGVRCRIL